MADEADVCFAGQEVNQQDAIAIHGLVDQLASNCSDNQYQACKQLFTEYVDIDHYACQESVHRLVITC